ncbi:MAG TPA: AsmA-like C-terminal region-containing protein [Nordella sp.]|nr:AsmA-like C-terminal region-containing protein [Nordella sp.]
MRKTLLAILAVVAVLLVAAGTFVTSRIRTVSADLAQRVESHAGVAVTSSGLPGISLWPRFSVSLGNVVVPAPKGSTSAPLATIETLRIVPADGLFGWGDSGIAEVVLEKPSINLVIGADGRANWDFDAKPFDAKPGAVEPEGLPLRIAGGRIAFLDERTGSAVALADVEAQTSLSGPADELTAKGAFVWNERRAAFTLFLKSPQRVAEDGSPADITLQAPGLFFQFSGRTALIKGFELDGQSEIKGTDLGLAASWFGAKLPSGLDGARFELAGAVDSSAQGLLFTNAQFALDDMRGQGDVGLALGKSRPKLDADVTVQTIDLTRYSGAAATANKAFLTTPWSLARLDLSALRSLDAILEVGTNAFAYGAFRTGPAELSAHLQDGILDLKIAKAAYAEGTLDLALVVDGKADTPAIQFTANGEGIAADRALTAALGFGDLRGRLSPSFTLQASGQTLADLVSTLKGQASFRTVSGTLTGIDLQATFGKVATAILDGWGRDERQSTTFDAISGTFVISDGIAQTSNLILSSPSLTFTGKGEVDLLRQALDLKVDPQLPVAASAPDVPQQAAFPVAIQVRGPWTAPRIYPDMPGILEDPASGYAALKKLGLGTPD